MLTSLLLSFLLFQAAQPQSVPQQQTPGAQQANAEVEKATLEGKVVSALDGEALKKASVTVMMQQAQRGNMVRPITARTGPDGKFRFTELDAGSYTVRVTRNGYAPTTYGQRGPDGPGTAITLLAGQKVSDIVVRLQPSGAISGRIVDEDNDPADHVSVTLMRWRYFKGKRQLMPFGFAQTDDRGQYRIFGVPDGRYFVSATMQQNTYGVVANDSAEPSYAPTYYPGTNDVSQATLVNIRAGDDQGGFNFRLLPGRAVRVSGILRRASGEPASESFVQIWPRGLVGPIRNQYQMADAKGNFSFASVLPGAYVLIAGVGSRSKDSEMAVMEIEVSSEPVENLTLQLSTGYDLEVDVHLDGAVDLTKKTLRLLLAPDEMIPMQQAPAEVKQEGPVTLSGVLDGTYRVQFFNLPEDAYISRVEYDDKDGLAEPIKIRGAGNPLSVTISANGARVEGSVRKDNKPFPGATVALVPEESKRTRLDLYRTASTDQYGHFSLRGIPPGSYKIFAWEAIDPGAYQDPDFLKTYEDEGKTLLLGPGEQNSQDLKLIPAAKTGA